MKKVLNVGGNNKNIAIPDVFDGYEHLLLDIDAKGKPDILCNAREHGTLSTASFDAVYCSHNLEHYYRHEVPIVLAGFLHVLAEDGFALIRVPDIAGVMQRVVEEELDLNDVLYKSPAGPITVNDVIYGFGAEIARSGNDYFAHKTGFSKKSLFKAIKASGFARVYCWVSGLEVCAFGFKSEPDDKMLRRLNLKRK